MLITAISKRFFLLFFIITFSIIQTNIAQELPVASIKEKIDLFKNNDRGPYKGINWFCEDGTIRDARDPCPEPMEGLQHASYRPDTKDLATRYHLFFGEVLASTDRTAFWDEANNQSRLKQYQLNKYLENVDDGWIQRKSQYYRGAIQSEDEQEWGVAFYERFLPRDSRLTDQYFLMRQSLRDIPHDGDNNLAQEMRSQSKVISDKFVKFMDARIKIHGNPSSEDIKMVKDFEKKYEDDLSPDLKNDIDELVSTMKKFHAPVRTSSLKSKAGRISRNNATRDRLLQFFDEYDDAKDPSLLVGDLADILCVVRTEITDATSGNDRLLLLDISNSIEDILLKKTQEWKPNDLSGLMEKTRQLSLAAAGTGLIELWEWQRIEPLLEAHLGNTEVTLEQLNAFLQTARGVVEWSAAMVKANYGDVVETYTQFEPLAYSFIDDRIRSTIALDLGETVSKLGSFIAEKANLSNKVFKIDDQSSVRGLNPGYAFGELVVIEGSPENIDIDPTKIYVFQKPPSDLKPVAGIMTVSEGNLVSHVQLLARNLGIPNAALSGDNLKDLKKYDGKKIFYAVSEKGNVIMKEADDMEEEEEELFSKQERSKEKIAVPVEEIRLDVCETLNMAKVGAKDSGKLCGPKAANLGQLKSMFPENVVNGIVIPFGIFRNHMEQQMPGENESYWSFLIKTFAQGNVMRNRSISEKKIETFQLERLSRLRSAIEKMPLNDDFVSEMERDFKNIFGNNIGNVPVFLRSDTNMEDLKEFTGAGLNLTLFNILSRENIIEGIKKVWASPYTERSYKWRQQYLSNPENVFPSILIIPSVDVEYSGVMITKGINNGNEDDLTVAFSRGAGGAVDGQIAETRLIMAQEDRLLAPARETNFLRLPATGGTTKNTTYFQSPILNQNNIESIRDIAHKIRTKIPEETGTDYKGAWDVELGFENDKLWLFQIRPFVENKNAKSSEYLSSISPKIDYSKKISVKSEI